jgi:1-acyl-sn-glycerol-3-phosphate acyltransferase
VDLSAWQGLPLDAEVLAGATEAIMAAVTGLLEQIRGEPAPVPRWDPRLHDQPRFGDHRRSRRPAAGEGSPR